MTLILQLCLDIMKMLQHAENNCIKSSHVYIQIYNRHTYTDTTKSVIFLPNVEVKVLFCFVTIGRNDICSNLFNAAINGILIIGACRVLHFCKNYSVVNQGYLGTSLILTVNHKGH